MTPALEPNPRSASRNTALRAAGESAGAAARRSPKSLVTAPAARSKKAASRRANPAWVMARYHPPAWTVSGSSVSVRTRKYEVRDMPSHIRRKVSTFAGAGDQTHREEKQIQHGAEEAQRAATLIRLGVPDPVDGARNGDEADEAEEKGAQGVEPEYEAVRDREERGHLQDERRSADEDLEGEAETGPASHHGPRRDQATHETAARGQHRDGGPERVPGKHEAEQKRHWAPRAHRRRPMAARMPWRMATGSGGQPSTKASTGMIWSTLPATA